MLLKAMLLVKPQSFGRRTEQTFWQTLLRRFIADQKSKHSSAKAKRAKFDSEESYKTFARRHHRRQHNEFLKQQVSKGWEDVWDTPKGAAKMRQADDIAASLPDEQLWLWMTQGSASARTAKQQRKAWRIWTRQFQESENYSHYYQAAQDDSTSNTGSDKRERFSWGDSWQHFGKSQRSIPWQEYFRAKFAETGDSSKSQKQHRETAGCKVSEVQQQHCMHVLGLSPTSVLDATVIRTAFLECAKRWHPDRHTDHAKSDAESKFKEAQTAYQHLLTCL